MRSNNQKGFSPIEIMLVVLIAVALGFVGWKFYANRQDKIDSTDTTLQTQQTAPEVETAQDLQKAEDFLNQTDIDQELDTSEIDTALSE